MVSAISSTVCSVCGHSLGAGDVCVACLLRAGLDETDGAIESPAFGDFVIERRNDGALAELGRGAMGVTYRARDQMLHREVALKVIELQSANGDSDAIRERFLREARAAAALRHPRIAGVFRFGASENGDRCYCAMELVEGETLEARVRRDGPLGVNQTLEIAEQVAEALIAAAERGLVHRDIKPGNIMLAADGADALQVKVIDFGLAKAAAGAAEMELTHGAFVGTPAFASPEQFAGGAIDARTDIYALGITMWFALTGRLPFGGTTIDEIRERQEKRGLPIDQLQARDVSQPVVELLQSCLAQAPADRPASARDLMTALETCRALLRNKASKRKTKLIAIATTLFLLAAGIVAAVLLRQREKPQSAQARVDLLEHSTVEKRPTDNSEAYLLFLRARNLELQRGAFEEAIPLYRQAIVLDPNFAQARARLSISISMLNSKDETLLAEAKTEAEKALQLRPNLGEARLAMAHYFISYARDYDRALTDLRRAAELMPNSAEVQLAAAFIYKKQARFQERLEALRRAAALAPQDRHVNSFLILTLRWVRDWRGAMDAIDRRTITSLPADLFVAGWLRAQDEFRLTGDIQALKRALPHENTTALEGASADWANFAHFEVALFERDFIRAATFLEAIPDEAFDLSRGTNRMFSSHPKTFYQALISVAQGRPAEESAAALNRAAEQAGRELSSGSYNRGRSWTLAQLAILDVLRGRKQDAIRKAQEAIELFDARSSSIERNDMSAALALVYAQMGEADKALDLIEHLLTVPAELEAGTVYNMTLTDLKWRWVWDPLRSHPRFQRLIAEPEPKTNY